MSKRKSYFKLVYNEYGYDIYAVEKGKISKLNNSSKMILYKLLRKFDYIKKDENTFIFPNFKLITLYFARECIKKRKKKVNRGKSKRVLAGILAGVILTGGVYILKAQDKEINYDDKALDNTSISDYEENLQFNDLDVIFVENNKYNNDEKIDSVSFEEDEILDLDISYVSSENFDVVEDDAVYEEIECGNTFNYEWATPNDKEALENSSAYMNLFQKYEKIYGIDANLLCAIGAQESSGVHRSVSMNGGYATGLMGIENIWADGEIRVFNFDKNAYETIVVDYSRIGDLEYNIKVGAAIFQNYFYNTIRNNDTITESEKLAFAIQKYNMGPGNMGKVLNYGGDWIGNRSIVDGGDDRYFEHVLSRLDNGTVLKIKLDDGSYFETEITNVSLEHHKNNVIM